MLVLELLFQFEIFERWKNKDPGFSFLSPSLLNTAIQAFNFAK